MWIIGWLGLITLLATGVVCEPDTWYRLTCATPWPARYRHTTGRGAGSRVWLLGGIDGDDRPGEPRTAFNDVWWSDDVGVTWVRATVESGPNAPYGLMDATLLYLSASDYLVVLGGRNAIDRIGDFNHDPSDQSNVNLYFSRDGVTWQTQTLGPPTPGRIDAGVVLMPGSSDRIMMCGGTHPTAPNAPLSDCWLSAASVMPSPFGWVSTPQIPGRSPFIDGRTAHAMLSFGQSLYVSGGYVGSALNVSNDVWRSVDGSNWTCLTANAGWQPRAYHHMLFDSAFHLTVFGGTDLPTADPRTGDLDLWYTVGDGAASVWVRGDQFYGAIVLLQVTYVGSYGVVTGGARSYWYETYHAIDWMYRTASAYTCPPPSSNAGNSAPGGGGGGGNKRFTPIAIAGVVVSCIALAIVFAALIYAYKRPAAAAAAAAPPPPALPRVVALLPDGSEGGTMRREGEGEDASAPVPAPVPAPAFVPAVVGDESDVEPPFDGTCCLHPICCMFNTASVLFYSVLSVVSCTCGGCGCGFGWAVLWFLPSPLAACRALCCGGRHTRSRNAAICYQNVTLVTVCGGFVLTLIMTLSVPITYSSLAAAVFGLPSILYLACVWYARRTAQHASSVLDAGSCTECCAPEISADQRVAHARYLATRRLPPPPPPPPPPQPVLQRGWNPPPPALAAVAVPAVPLQPAIVITVSAAAAPSDHHIEGVSSRLDLPPPAPNAGPPAGPPVLVAPGLDVVLQRAVAGVPSAQLALQPLHPAQQQPPPEELGQPLQPQQRQQPPQHEPSPVPVVVAVVLPPPHRVSVVPGGLEIAAADEP